MTGNELRDLLAKGAKMLRVDVSDKALDLFLQYLENLKKWNSSINLTAIKDDKEIVLNHFLDSISVVRLIANCGDVLDIGSGGGFPGIPIKIVRPELNITLLDAVNKKVSFMNDTIRKLELKDIRAIWGRAEDSGNNIPRNCFDYVITRAVGGIEEITQLGLPYLSENGEMILMRGRQGISEWNRVKNEVRDRVEFKNCIEFTLPFIEKKRTIIVLKQKH